MGWERREEKDFEIAKETKWTGQSGDKEWELEKNTSKQNLIYLISTFVANSQRKLPANIERLRTRS